MHGVRTTYNFGKGSLMMIKTRKQMLLAAPLMVLGMAFAQSALADNHGKAAKGQAAEMMKKMDTNKDGMVSKDEFMKMMSEKFDKMDSKKMGKMDAQQLEKLFTDLSNMPNSSPG